MTTSQFKLDIPDGEYEGIWTGNVVHLTIDKVSRSFTTTHRNAGLVSSVWVNILSGMGSIHLRFY